MTPVLDFPFRFGGDASAGLLPWDSLLEKRVVSGVSMADVGPHRQFDRFLPEFLCRRGSADATGMLQAGMLGNRPTFGVGDTRGKAFPRDLQTRPRGWRRTRTSDNVSITSIAKGFRIDCWMQKSSWVLKLEIEREEDGRWIAEVPDLPGVMVYGDTRQVATAKVQALALRVLADRLEHGEMSAEPVRVRFIEAA